METQRDLIKASRPYRPTRIHYTGQQLQEQGSSISHNLPVFLKNLHKSLTKSFKGN